MSYTWPVSIFTMPGSAEITPSAPSCSSVWTSRASVIVVSLPDLRGALDVPVSRDAQAFDDRLVEADAEARLAWHLQASVAQDEWLREQLADQR